MSIDDLQLIRDAALNDCSGSSVADQYERGAIMMGWEGLTGERAEAATDVVRVELRGADVLGSYPIGRISTAMQNAVAYIGKYQRNPRISPQAAVSEADRRRFQIVQEAQVGNTLVFRVPAIPVEPATVPIGKYSTVAGRAVRELIDTLPRADDDAWSTAGILGSAPLIRKAVHDISKAAVCLPDGIELTLIPDSGGERAAAALSHARAVDLKHELDDANNKVGTELHTGLLDGLRGTRRVFYLVLDDDSEIAGAVDAEMVGDVERFEHRRVTVQVETTQWVKRNGRLGKKAYRLLTIGEAPEQLVIEHD